MKFKAIFEIFGELVGWWIFVANGDQYVGYKISEGKCAKSEVMDGWSGALESGIWTVLVKGSQGM